MKNPILLMARWLLRLALALCALASPLIWAQTPQTSGQWQNGPDFPYFPTHIHLLPNSTVMIWPGDGVSGDDPRVWDPVSGNVTSLSRVGFDPFCSAHTFLPDGRLFVAGGHIENWLGLPDAATYNPVNNTWTRQARMNLGRWYPSVTGLPNGDVLVVAGSVDTANGSNPLPQVWQAATGTWRDLTDAQFSLPTYPYMFLAPNGSVFNAGPEAATRYLNTAGTGAWTFVANRTVNAYRDYGSAVMYEPGKILVVGGSDPPTHTAEVIDLNAAIPSWRAVGSMSVARRQMNATMLPTGDVLVTGGTRGAGGNNGDPGMPVLEAELWNPVTQNWSVMAAGKIARLYHSTALLLPDARVLITGGNGFTQTEIFSPPYLFGGARPVISSAPASVGKGQSFFVGTPDAAGINGVSWVALPSVTHTNNMHQGFFRSASIAQAAGGINIVAPNSTTVPPGHYMVFLLRNGVPSTARVIQLGPQSNNPVPSVSSLAPASATAGGPAFSLTVNGSNFVSGVSTVRWNRSNRTTTFVSATQLRAAITASDIAAAGSAGVSVFNSAPGGGTSSELAFTINAASNNPVPVLSSIAPTSAAAGGAAFTLTATGTGFVAASKVRWNNAERTTTYVSATQLTAAIAASDLQAAGTAQVTVVTPTPGGGTSATRAFTISSPGGGGNNPVPALTSLAPASATAGGAGFTLTVNGSGFVAGATVRWNGADRPTAFISATQVSAAIPAADTATAGTAPVTVFNPTPGGGVSPARSFSIAASQNLTSRATTIIAKITAPQGGGSRNLEVIRDGVMPAASSADWTNQYDTYDGPNTAADDWIGYQFSSTQTFNRVVFQEGINFSDGGWFNNLTVQVRQGGNWVNVSSLASTPAYPGSNNNVNYETYTLQFASISGDAIRLFGAPGGSAAFISVAELQVHGAASAAPADLTSIGTIIAKITAPQGGGSRNLQIIRDGVTPAVGSTNSSTQYDTYDGPNTAADDWIGYQFSSSQTFNRVVFQEGIHFGDGGWFNNLTVQVRRAGSWVNVASLSATPAYPGRNNGVNYETYTLQFAAISGDAIRIFGAPGGSAAFISVGELRVYAP
ncbi:MAG: Kelch domain protein [Polaromonas sp.]|nr:Kelch domain protein [Polaromonas sp.]